MSSGMWRRFMKREGISIKLHGVASKDCYKNSINLHIKLTVILRCNTYITVAALHFGVQRT